MPINASFEYLRAQETYLKATTTEDKIKCLKNMIATAPKHKGSEKLLLQLKRKLADLKKDQIKEKKAGKKKSLAIKKEGAATIVFVSIPDSGKSKLFANLTRSQYAGENNYTTKMRMMPYENVWLQALDLPSFYAGFAESGNAGLIFGLIRTADVIILVANDEPQLKLLQDELEKGHIKISAQKFLGIDRTELPAIAVTSEVSDIEKLKEKIWIKTGKIRVQTKTAGKIAPKPVVLKAGATVRDLAGTVHHDFVRNFKHAKIWGPSAKFKGQAVGLDHKLIDKDVVEVFTK